MKFISLHESQRGKLLAAEAEVVDHLETIRSIVLDSAQVLGIHARQSIFDESP